MPHAFGRDQRLPFEHDLMMSDQVAGAKEKNGNYIHEYS